MKNQLYTGIIFLVALLPFTGCYYDKEELLYPDSACDTTAVAYSTSVIPILSASCYSCHAGTVPSGGIRLDNHASVTVYAGNGKLMGAITHSPGYSAMPKNSGKLSNCKINIIRKWIDDGAPNN